MKIISGFNPRSHEGNDLGEQTTAIDKKSFNPRSHEGNDHMQLPLIHRILVSIHVPTRGTTAITYNFHL